MRAHALLMTVFLVMSGTIAGCSAYTAKPVSPNAPFFSPDAQDVKFHHMYRQKADQLLATCAGNLPCERARFLRGMVALYEDRELAATHFKAAVAADPGTNVGSASQFWLQLLKESDSYNSQAPFAQATARLVRELVDQELMLRQAASAATAATATDVTALKQELKIRDKQVEDLMKQLEALKQIDREMRDMTVPARPAGKPVPSLKPSEGA